jgi:hypothetical protein
VSIKKTSLSSLGKRGKWMRDEFHEMELSSMRSETLRSGGGEKKCLGTGEGLKPFKVLTQQEYQMLRPNVMTIY